MSKKHVSHGYKIAAVESRGFELAWSCWIMMMKWKREREGEAKHSCFIFFHQSHVTSHSKLQIKTRFNVLKKEIFKLACRSKQKPGMWLQKFKEETSASGNEKMISEAPLLKFERIYKTKTNIYILHIYNKTVYNMHWNQVWRYEHEYDGWWALIFSFLFFFYL